MDTRIENISAAKMAKIIYILNFVGIILPFCTLVGVILAYVFREDGQGYLQTHFRYLIRTFWISILYYVASGILCLLVVGYALLFLTLIWWIVRNAIGLKNVLHGREMQNPETWWF